MERTIAHRGTSLTVAYAVAANGASPGLVFYEELSVRDQAKMSKLFKWLGDHGWIKNNEKFKPINNEFFEFKSFQIRMPCYRSGDLMIITHGFIKKKGPISPEELKRAERIKNEDRMMFRNDTPEELHYPKKGQNK